MSVLATRLDEWALFAEGRVQAKAGPWSLHGDLRSAAVLLRRNDQTIERLTKALSGLAAVYDDEFGIVGPEMDAALDALAAAPSGVTATGVSADPGGTETKPEQNLHEKGEG